MKNKLFLVVFGLTIAGLTGAGSIYATIHPEKVSEMTQLVQRVAGVEAGKNAQDVDSSAENPVRGREEDVLDIASSQSASNKQGMSASKDRDGDDDREVEDDSEEEDGDDHSGANTGAVATSPVPAQTPTTSTNVKTFTMAQVAAHHTSADCYTTIGGSVYNLTPFIASHPGGISAISSLCGIDGAAAFAAQHGGQGKPEQELASLKIGILSQ